MVVPYKKASIKYVYSKCLTSLGREQTKYVFKCNPKYY